MHVSTRCPFVQLAAPMTVRHLISLMWLKGCDLILNFVPSLSPGATPAWALSKLLFSLQHLSHLVLRLPDLRHRLWLLSSFEAVPALRLNLLPSAGIRPQSTMACAGVYGHTRIAMQWHCPIEDRSVADKVEQPMLLEFPHGASASSAI